MPNNEELRFRVFITAAMRAIQLRDGIATRIAGAAPAKQAEFPPQLCTIPSPFLAPARTLEAWLVTPVETPYRSVLILHGIGERLSYWHDAQQLLASQGIASLVFHYSGYGKSAGAITPANLRNDTIAAYATLRELVRSTGRPFVLGLSLGTGVAVDAVPHLQPSPRGVVLCEPFSSLRRAAFAVCDSLGLLGNVLRPLARFVPDVYRTAASIHRVRSPLLIVHSDADELFPVAMAREIHRTAELDPDRTAELVVPPGFAHNDAYLRPSPGYWQPILDFIERNSEQRPRVVRESTQSARIAD